MAAEDVVITFGANIDELQDALGALKEVASADAEEISSVTEGTSELEGKSKDLSQALNGQFDTTKKAASDQADLSQNVSSNVDKSVVSAKNGTDSIKKMYLEIQKEASQFSNINDVAGKSVFNLGHAAVQGGSALLKAEKQLWKDMHNAFLQMISDKVKAYVAGQLQMLELTQLFGRKEADVNAALKIKQQSGEKASTSAVIANQQAQTTAVQIGAAKRQAAEQGSQGAQTGAVEAGNAARTASDSSASATQSATQSEGVMSHAKSTFAAVYDDVAQIPYVGWLLAPPAAAAAFAAVAAYSAAGGWERVPYDGALTELHKDEMVLPATVANTVRAASSAVGAYGLPSQSKQWANPAQPPVSTTASQGNGGQPVTLNYTPSVSAIDTRGARDFLDQHGRYIVDVLSRQQRNFAQVKK